MLLKKLYNKLIAHRWDIGFILNSIDDIINGKDLSIRYLKNPYNNRWFADPFILSFDENKIVLLVEDFWNSDQLGRISKLIIDRQTYEVLDVKVILQLDTHLSFPAIIRVDGKVYIYPENSRAGGLWIYEYDLNLDEIICIEKLSDLPLADAILTNAFGRKQLFSTKEPNPNKNLLDIYGWDNEKKAFEFEDSVTFEENIARNAGVFFEFGGKIYRPAQECNHIYGHAVSLQKVEKKGDSYQFTEVRRIMPPKGTFGIHTFNIYKGLTVIDMKVFRHSWLARPLYTIRNSLSYL